MEAAAKRIVALMRRRPDWTLAVALLAGLVVCLEARSLLSGRVHPIEDPRYLVARRALAAGQGIHFLDFTVTSSPAAIPKRALTDQDLPLLTGATLLRSFAEGEVVTLDSLHLPGWEAPLGSTVPEGLRAYAIQPVNSLDVRPGDRVDVILRSERESEQAMPLVDAALVLQTGRGESPVELVLALASDDIQLLEKALQRGKLTIALRNPGEQSSPKKHRAPHRVRRVAPRKPIIEVWSEKE